MINLVLYYCSNFVPFLCGLYYYRNLTKEIQILTWFFLFVVLYDATAYYFMLRGNNLWVIHFYLPIEFGIWMIVLSSWQRSALLKKVLIYSVPIFALFSIINSIFFERLYDYPSHSLSLEATLFIGICAYTIFILSRDGEKLLTSDGRFWILFGKLFSSLCTLIMWPLSNLLKNIPNEFKLIYILFHLTAMIIANFLYAGGILCQGQNQRS